MEMSLSFKEIQLHGKPLSQLRLAELKEELDKRGLVKTGTKDELSERLRIQLIIEKQPEPGNSNNANANTIIEAPEPTNSNSNSNSNAIPVIEVRPSQLMPPQTVMAPIVNNTASSGAKTPVPGPSSATVNVAVVRSKSDREKKIGHRRVTEGGNVTYKKIETSQIMGSIQLGIQHAIGGLASKPERDLLMQDFMTVEHTHFPSGGSNSTTAHHYSDFRFKTYAPIAFRYFRDLFGIQPDDFLMSLCSVPMRELSNPGASGSIFYLTDDDEFIVKTVMLKECDFLQKLLPGYYMNLNQNPRTLLPKFFGLFCYQCNSKNVRLAVMNNLLPSSVKMHQKYDLKGSTYKRKASKSEQQKAYPTFKDLDFLEHHPEGIFLEADTCAALIKTMQRDCRVLESFKIMDYSLLVGIHNLDLSAKEKAEKRSKLRSSSCDEDEVTEMTLGTGLSRSRSINRQRLVAHSTALESIQAESEPVDAEDDVPPGGIPARNWKGERLLLFLGLIDILQSYRLRKKLEHSFKAMIHDGDTVSVHRPGFYAERFMGFMSNRVFKKIPSPLKHSPSKKRPPPKSKLAYDHGEKLQDSASTTGKNSKSLPKRVSVNENPVLGRPTILPEENITVEESTENETISLFETYGESGQFRSNLSVASSSSTSGVSSSRGNRIPTSPLYLERRNLSGTPTWTEGTPSFTESSDSADLVCSSSLNPPSEMADMDPKDSNIADENENEMDIMREFGMEGFPQMQNFKIWALIGGRKLLTACTLLTLPGILCRGFRSYDKVCAIS